MHQIFQSQCSVFFRGQQPNFNKCPIVFFLWCLICVNMILRWNMLSPDRLTTDEIYYNLSFSHGQTTKSDKGHGGDMISNKLRLFIPS